MVRTVPVRGTKGQQVICLGLFDKSYAVQTTNYSISLFSVSLSCSKPEEKVYTMQMEKGKRDSPSADVEPQPSLCSHRDRYAPVVTCSAFTHTAVQQRKHRRVGFPRSGLLTVRISSKLKLWEITLTDLSSARLGLKGGRLQHKLAAGKFSNNDITTYS